jgi:OCT family organic cation transporter-like MFS transporter 4/5
LIFQNKLYVFNLICLLFIWLSVSFGYYLISFQLKYIEGDLFLNGAVSSISEVCADALAGVFISRIGLKRVLQASYSISLIGMIMLIIDPHNKNNIVIASYVLGSKFGISSAFNTAYCANPMVFPVSIVATSLGICNFLSRLGTIFAPVVAEITPEWIPKFIFCIIVGTALVSATLLK